MVKHRNENTSFYLKLSLSDEKKLEVLDTNVPPVPHLFFISLICPNCSELKGCELEASRVKEATLLLMDQLSPNNPARYKV